jgi:tetratricopeptide (TPR) repeat protein
VYYNLAKVLEAQGRKMEMLPWLERAVQKAPSHADAWFELGRVLMATDLVAAEEAFTRSVGLKPAEDCWRNLARLRLRLCDWEGCAVALAQLPGDTETRTIAYRVACELGHDVRQMRAQLLAEASIRPDALKALTRVSRGSLPLKFPQAR